MRRVAGLAPLVTAAALLASGCGVSGQTASGPAVSAARLAAYARAVNVQEGDLPGLGTHSREGPDELREGFVAAFRCGGGGIVGTTQTIHSATFDTAFYMHAGHTVGHPEAVLSTLQLVPSAAAARRDVKADRTRSVQQCVANYLNAARGERGPLVDIRASIAPLPVSLSVAGFGFSATERERYKSAQPAAPRTRLERILGSRRGTATTTDYLGFARGRVIVMLVDEHRPQDPSRNNERRLLRLLHARASTHTL